MPIPNDQAHWKQWLNDNIISGSPSYRVPSRHKGRIGFSPQGCEEKDSSLLQENLEVSDVEAFELSNWYSIVNAWCWESNKHAKNVHAIHATLWAAQQMYQFHCFTSVSSCQLQPLPSVSLSKFISSWAREVQSIPLASPCGAIYFSGSETLLSDADLKSMVPSGALCSSPLELTTPICWLPWLPPVPNFTMEAFTVSWVDKA